MYVYIHGTPLVAIVKKCAGFGADNYPEEAESVENRPDSSQRTDVSAERLMHKDGKSHQGEEDEKFDGEQKSHP